MLNDRTVRQYIVDMGERPDNSKYCLKVKDGEEFIFKWDYSIRKPKSQELERIASLVAEEDKVTAIKKSLAVSDSNIARLAEDLCDLLITKGVIAEGDIDVELREKITERKTLRESL